MKIRIVHKTPEGELRQFSFEDKTPIRLGRSEKNDVRFSEPRHKSVSGEHAEIRIDGGRVFVVDVGSTNGVVLNDEKVSRAELRGGETLFLGPGGPACVVEIEGMAAGPELKAGGGARTELVPEIPKQKKYGERTVGMLVQRALLQAGLLKTGTSKPTDYFEALVERKVQWTRRRMRIALTAVIAVLVLGGAGVGIYVHLNRSVQYVQNTHVNYGEAVGSAVASANRYAVFLMVGTARETAVRQGFCTAFAISQNVLATNAHCVRTAEEKYTDIELRMNGAPNNRYEIRRMAAHPEYREGRLSPDVGLLLVTGILPNLVQLAPETALRLVAPGVPVFLYGFPGRLNRIDAPEATFIRGEIGRVTRIDQTPGELRDNILLQHSAYSSAGTSGSPMFNGEGQVIGINAGGYMEDGQALAGYNFGIRIDLVHALLPLLQKR